MKDLESGGRKTKKYWAWLEEEEKKLGMGLESYLITPIQRIPWYELLLMQCQKYTNWDLEDHDLLTQALTLVREVNQSNNASMSTQAEQDKRKQLNKMFEGNGVNLLEPQRKYIDTIQGLYMVEVNNKEPKDVVIFLF